MIRLITIAMVFVVGFCLYGCTTTTEAVVTKSFTRYYRVAIWSNLPRDAEDMFIPIYMKAFPYQTIIERRDIENIIGEQTILPDRLDDETRAELRKVHGVKAIIYPSVHTGQFAIKVIDTETGAIAASAYVTGKHWRTDKPLELKKLIRKAIAALKNEAEDW